MMRLGRLKGEEDLTFDIRRLSVITAIEFRVHMELIECYNRIHTCAQTRLNAPGQEILYLFFALLSESQGGG